MMKKPGVTWKDVDVLGEIDKLEKKAITKSCLLLGREIKVAMKSTPRSIDRAYKRQKKGKGIYHHPSAPGHPPAVDTGLLINSITHAFSWSETVSPKEGAVSKPGANRHERVGIVGSGIEYMRFLELGTRNMRPRPVLRATFAKLQPAILGFFK